MIIIFYDFAQFERPMQEQKSHLRPLHVKALTEGKPTNKVLIDGGVSINLIPQALLKKLGKNDSDFLATNLVVTVFSVKLSTPDGVVMLNVKLGLSRD